MNSRLLDAWPLAPLGLAAAGLLALSPQPRTAHAPRDPASAPPTAFTPPALFLASAHVSDEEVYVVDASASRALVLLNGDHPERRELSVRGSLRLIADESVAALELELESTLANGRHAVTLQIQGKPSPSKHSPIPGLHVADLEARATRGGLPRPTRLAATWIRLPGGKLRVQAVAERFDAYDDVIAAGSAPWTAEQHASLSLVLELDQERSAR